uniref:Splicing factor, suppressor of white-apricot homolog n=1 Tax=Erpetoichthys calabaricus TaxID=27687 RepID=A0A8C4TEV3_ERPCA
MYRRGVSKKDSKAVPNPEESGSGGKYAELLVFGYACKLFRDDERAAYHEQGRHLIPWMGDKNIMIDRYDGRGHLHDLSEYDADSWNRDYKLSEEEARIEALCDEERYLALHTDLLEEEARQEEEYKRLSEALADEGSYNAVGFQYSADYYDPSQPTEEEETSKETVADQEDSEEPFIAPAGLCVPPDVELPATTKMHAIIERTASFVCKQGTQFEIMLKAKQARNSQFDFLRFDHYLNPYYKHILKAMKEGKYVTAGEAKAEEKTKCEDDDSDDDDDDGNGDYLHPSLFASKKCDRLEELMKPLKVMDPDHPLAALVRKAQLENNMAAAKMSEEPLTVASKENEYSLDSTVATVYYGYYILPDGTYCLAPPPPGIDVNTYYSSLPAGVLSAASGSAATSAVHSATPPMSPGQASTQTTAATTSSQTSVAAIIPPPPDIQPVIDKLAEYVARNGAKFESSVRAKNDSRFDFLQSWHQYNAYYEFKKQYFIQKEGLDKPKVLAASESGNVADTPVLPQATNSPSVSNAENLITESTNSPDKAANEGKLIKASFAPISFAIKAKENDLLPLEKNRVKLDDDSDEEDKEGQENTSSVTAKESQPPVVEEKKPQLTQEELEAKQAKQKLEDRLAAAAREKLAQASKESKEKQLQAERKRKAALFLQNLKSPFLEVDTRKLEESSTLMEEALVEISHHGGMKQLSSAPCPEINIVPAAPTVVSKVVPVMESKITERDMDRNKVHSHVHEKEKKKKKHKKRSRSRSPSHSRYRSRSRSRSKAKHSLPSAYRTVRKSRSRSRSTSRRQPHSSERKREEREKDRCVPSAYRISNSPAFSKKRSRSSRGDSQEKEKEVSSAIVSSVQSKITQDLMAKVRAMLAASKDLQTSTS